MVTDRTEVSITFKKGDIIEGDLETNNTSVATDELGRRPVPHSYGRAGDVYVSIPLNILQKL